MSNIFEQLDSNLDIQPAVQSVEHVPNEPLPISVVETLPEQSDINVIPPKKRKKCIARKDDGTKCRRYAADDNVYCDSHLNPIVIEEPQAKPPIVLSPDIAVKSLLSLHVSIYMLSEAISRHTDYPLEGMVGKLNDDIDHVREVYGQIVEYYGVDNISSVISPITSLAVITSQHYVQSYIEGKKTKES